MRYWRTFSQMKKIIVNADDFGLTEGVNRGIISAYKKGIVTSVSLMANGNAFERAVYLLKNNPGLDAGIHLTLIEEKPLLPKKEIPSLVIADGNFIRNYFQFAKKYLLGRIVITEVEKESDAQFKKIIERGIKINHIDSHQHIHLIPGILKIVIKLAKKYGIRMIRCPLRFIPILKQSSVKNIFPAFALNLLSYNAYLTTKQKGLFSPLYCFRLSSYNTNIYKQIVSKIFSLADFHASEIICHPAELDDELLSRYRHWDLHWKEELKALTL